MVKASNNNDNRLTALYLRQPGELAQELSEPLTQYTTFIALKFLSNTPNLPSRPLSLPLRFNTKKNPGKQLKHAQPGDKNSHILYTCLILDLMRPLVDCWFPLTYASRCMTTSSHADDSESKHSQDKH